MQWIARESFWLHTASTCRWKPLFRNIFFIKKTQSLNSGYMKVNKGKSKLPDNNNQRLAQDGCLNRFWTICTDVHRLIQWSCPFYLRQKGSSYKEKRATSFTFLSLYTAAGLLTAVYRLRVWWGYWAISQLSVKISAHFALNCAGLRYEVKTTRHLSAAGSQYFDRFSATS